MATSKQSPTKRQLLVAMEALHQGVALIDTDSSEWTFTWFNQAFAALTAERVGALGDDSARNLLERLGGAAAVTAMRDAVSAATEREWPIVLSDNQRLSVRFVPLVDADGVRTAHGWLMLRYNDAYELEVRKLTTTQELALTRRRLRDLSHDPATGLAGEQNFRQALRRDAALAARQRTSLSVIVVRMDAFDAYRATFGDHATDSCLRMLARTITRRLRRGSDLAARASVACLAMLMHDIDSDDARAFAERIANDVDALRIHHPRSDSARYVTVSYQARSVSPDADFDSERWLDELLATFDQPVAPPALIGQG